MRVPAVSQQRPRFVPVFTAIACIDSALMKQTPCTRACTSACDSCTQAEDMRTPQRGQTKVRAQDVGGLHCLHHGTWGDSAREIALRREKNAHESLTHERNRGLKSSSGESRVMYSVCSFIPHWLTGGTNPS